MKEANLIKRGMLPLMMVMGAIAMAAPVAAAPGDAPPAPGTALSLPPPLPPPPLPPADPQSPDGNPSAPGNGAATAVPSAAPGNGPATAGSASNDPLSALAWLRGCWQGKVNQREFREMWLAPLGGVMLGASHTVLQGKTSDFEFMRIEQRPDSTIVYSLAVPEQKEVSYQLSAPASEEFAFVNAGVEFPTRIVYRPGTDGWLYARVEGKVKGESKQVIYPMRHVDCISGEFVLK